MEIKGKRRIQEEKQYKKWDVGWKQALRAPKSLPCDSS